MSDTIFCERCRERLDESKAVLLFLNIRTGAYRRRPWPQGDCQGGFWFGAACAKRALKGDTKKKARTK